MTGELPFEMGSFGKMLSNTMSGEGSASLKKEGILHGEKDASRKGEAFQIMPQGKGRENPKSSHLLEGSGFLLKPP